MRASRADPVAGPPDPAVPASWPLGLLKRLPLMLGSPTGLLLVNGVLVNLFGAVFWLLATGLYAANTVGVYATFTASVIVAQNIGSLGLAFGANRFLPHDDAGAARFINAIMTLAGLGWLIAAVGVVGVSALIGWNTAASGIGVAFFVVYVIALGPFGFFDHLLSLRGASWAVVVDNLVSNVVRLGLAAALVGMGIWGLLWSNLIGVAISLAVTLFVLMPRIIPGFRARPTINRALWRRVLPYSLMHSASGWLWALPPQLVIMIGASLFGATVMAFYATAWLYAAAVQFASGALATRAVVDLRLAAPGKLRSVTRTALWRGAAAGSLSAAAGWLCAPLILSLFGDTYQREAMIYVPWLMVGILPNAIAAVLTQAARQRAQERLTWTACLAGPVVTVLALVVARGYGPEATGFAWAVGQLAVAAVLVGALAFEHRKPLETT